MMKTEWFGCLTFVNCEGKPSDPQTTTCRCKWYNYYIFKIKKNKYMANYLKCDAQSMATLSNTCNPRTDRIYLLLNFNTLSSPQIQLKIFFKCPLYPYLFYLVFSHFWGQCETFVVFRPKWKNILKAIW